MNITEETNDYYKIIRLQKEGVKVNNYPLGDFKGSTELTSNCINDYCNANSALKDKLKTTPDPAIKKISKAFRVDWSKVFKRGWLLWR